MPSVCSVCSHPKRAEIDKKLAIGECGIRDTAKRWGLGKSAVFRHAHYHLDVRLIEAAKRSLEASDETTVVRTDRLVKRLEKLCEACEGYGSGKELLEVARELRPALELLGKFRGEIQQKHQITIEIKKPEADPAQLEEKATRFLRDRGFTVLLPGKEAVA